MSPSRCLAFEDSQSGVESAKSAGMTVIAVPNFFTTGQDHTSADYKMSRSSDSGFRIINVADQLVDNIEAFVAGRPQNVVE